MRFSSGRAWSIICWRACWRAMCGRHGDGRAGGRGTRSREVWAPFCRSLVRGGMGRSTDEMRTCESLFVAAVLAGAWAIYQLRLRQIRSRFGLVLEERARLAREIHDTLAQGFVGI